MYIYHYQMIFAFQIYIRWKRDISPVLQLLEQYLISKGYQKIPPQGSDATIDTNTNVLEQEPPTHNNTVSDE